MMSDYPQTHFFGASFGSRDQADPPYLPPIYPTQYLQPDDGRTGRAPMATNSSQSMAAYDRHGNVPNFSAAAMASGVPPLPIFQGWNRDPIPLPPYTTSHHGVHTSEYTSIRHRQDFLEPLYEPSPKESGQVHARDAQSHPQAINPIEEGELSEGEFEGGFAPADSAPVGLETRRGPAYDGTGYHDTAHRAVHARSPDQSAPQSFSRTGTNYSHNREPPQRNYQRSDLYSPSASPREVDYDANSQRYQQQYLQGPTYSQSPQSPRYESGHTNGILQSHLQQSWTRNDTESSGLRYHADENHDPKSGETPNEHSNVQGPLSHAVSPSYKSVGEARKKAQGAILNLWPLEVRFQNYIDEGFDESLIQGLFGDIGMPNAPSKTVSETARSSNQFHDTRLNSHDKTSTNITTMRHAAHPPVPVDGYFSEHDKSESISRPPGLSQIIEPKPLEANAAPEAQPAKADEKEERKDRIARLIAAKTNKQLPSKTPSSVPTLTSPSSNTITTSTAPQTIASTEKERLLRMKMEALQKSREARALKAAAKINTTSLTVAEVQQPVPPKQIASVAALPSPSMSPFPAVQQCTNCPTHSPSPVHGISLPPAPPAIPGLFLASSAASPVPSTMPHSIVRNIAQVNNQRKRPVAADFEGPATTFSSLKRPFGQSRNDQPLVIDVSDDEPESDDEDVAMEIDSQVDQSSLIQTTKALVDYRSTALSHLPPLSDFPVGKRFTSPPSSTMNTPPVTQVATKAILGKPADLQRKEKEIEEMKKKIAEAERRKKAKKTSSGTHTPLTTDATGVERKDNSNVIIASNVEASIQIEHMINVADNKVNADQQRLAEAQAAELEQAAELKRNEAERKRLRREKIATDLPLVDAEVQQNQIKLEQLRAEMAKIEAAVQKNLTDKQHMAEEMEKLGQEAEDQLQAQKDKLRDLTREETESRAASSRPISEPIAEAQQINKITSSSGNQNQSSASPSRDLHQPISKSKPAIVEFAQQPSVPLSNASNALIVASVNDGFTHNGEQRKTSSDLTRDESHDSVTSDQALDAALQEATARAEAESHVTTWSDTDMEDSYAPDPGRLAPQSVTSPVEEERPTSLASALAGDTSSDSSEESDNYEPPEATPPVADMQSPIESPPFSPAPPEPVIELFHGGIQDDLTVMSLAADNNVQDSIIDSPAPQVQRTAQSTENRHKEHSNHDQFYTPYESPLRHFHVYRFHPDFKQQVPGGFRSLTYSHKIDPKKKLCRYELAGGVCNDPTCELQHFRDMGLPDDAVLAALGSPDEYDGERKSKFVAGLREVLQDLRSKKIKDFDIIASEIAAFRSKFLGDNKVLVLKDTSI